MAMREHAKSLVESNPDSAILLCNQVFTLSEKVHFTRGMDLSRRTKGLAFEFKNMLDSAMTAYDEAIAIVKASKDQKQVAEIINFKGVAYYYAGDFGKALQYYNEALSIQDSIGDIKGQAFTLNNIGVIYRRTKNHHKALKAYEESFNLKLEIGDSIGMANSLHNIGMAWAFLDNDSSSVTYFNEALHLFELLDLPEEYASTQLGLAQALFNLRRLDESENLLDECANIILQKNSREKVVHLIYNGLLLNERGKREEGMKKIRQGYDMIRGTDQYELLIECERELYKAFKIAGQNDSALIHLEEFMKLEEFLTSAKREQLQSEMEAKFESFQKENTIKLQHVEIEKKEQEKLNLYFIIGTAILLLTLVLTIAVIKSRSNKLLSEKKKVVESTLAEKEILLKEIHHRVKNNLQIVSSLLSVQSRQINDPGALRAVNESRNRVQSMALIHQNLYRDNDLTGVDMREYIPKLCAELFSAYKMDEDILKLSTDITIKSLDVDTAIPLGLIINELITNALKYAFKPDEEGLLEVKLYEMNQELILEVNDDGKSSSQMENSENPGFGTKMINSFLSKLEGHMTVTQDGGRKVKILIRKFRAV